MNDRFRAGLMHSGTTETGAELPVQRSRKRKLLPIKLHEFVRTLSLVSDLRDKMRHFGRDQRGSGIEVGAFALDHRQGLKLVLTADDRDKNHLAPQSLHLDIGAG